MCTPIYNKSDNPIQAAMCELISASSALNMHPEAIPNHKSINGYLSETDAWAKHSQEHLRAAFKHMRDANKEIDDLKYKIMKLKIKLRVL